MGCGLVGEKCNERWVANQPTSASAVAVWDHYLDRWTLLNTIRTVAAGAATLMFTLGLMQGGGV